MEDKYYFAKKQQKIPSIIYSHIELPETKIPEIDWAMVPISYVEDPLENKFLLGKWQKGPDGKEYIIPLEYDIAFQGEFGFSLDDIKQIYMTFQSFRELKNPTNFIRILKRD